MNQNYLLLSLLVITQFITAQKSVYKIPDSLQNQNYNYLEQRSYDLQKDSSKAAFYINVYIKKAKNEQNWKELVNGYQNILHQSPEKVRLIYADSMIYAAKKSKDNALMGSAYLSKGIVYYGLKQQRKALDNYIIANNFISRTNDYYQIHKVKYNIAQIKYYLGFYDEAVSLLKECVTYFIKEENPRPYLNSLHSLGLCYNKIGNYGLCSETNSLGLSESKRLENSEMIAYFIHSDGLNEYFMHNYASAIRKISSVLPDIRKNKDFANETVGYFYIGKSYWSLNKIEKALPYFYKVDKTFEDKSYMRPDLREVYELLISYHKSNDNPEMQLHYINKLLKADSILDNTYKYLSGKIHKEYDTKELLLAKTNIENLLNKRKYNDYLFISVITILFFLLLYLSYRHLKNKSQYRQKFEELMKKNETSKVSFAPKNIKPGVLDINQDAVAAVLKQLEKFERDKKFLEKDLTLVKLSASFDSNTKYLSKIIYHYRGKKFVEYLNDLKVDYLVELLKTDKIIRNYTYKALAEEAGFSSTQRFTNAFLSRTEITPLFFIEEIKKELS